MAGVTTFDRQGMPDHFARVVTYTTPQFDRDREFTGQGVLELHAPSDQIDMDVMVKLSLLPHGEDKPRFMKVSQGWLWASHRAEDADLTSDMQGHYPKRSASGSSWFSSRAPPRSGGLPFLRCNRLVEQILCATSLGSYASAYNCARRRAKRFAILRENVGIQFLSLRQLSRT